MKRSFALHLAGGLLAILLVCGLAAPAFAACPCYNQPTNCPQNEYLYSQQSGCIRYEAPFNVSGAQVQNWSNLNVTGVVDARGCPVIATLSSDGHYYIIPIAGGYRYIGTGY